MVEFLAVWNHFYCWRVLLVKWQGKMIGRTGNPINLFENTYRMGSLVFGGGQVLMPMMYEQFSVRPDAIKEKDPMLYRIDKEDMYTGMGIVRAMPGPVFSIASFTGGMALKDMGKHLKKEHYAVGWLSDRNDRDFFTQRIAGSVLLSYLE